MKSLLIFSAIIMMLSVLGFAACGGGAAVPDPAAGSTWDQMEWGQGKWG